MPSPNKILKAVMNNIRLEDYLQTIEDPALLAFAEKVENLTREDISRKFSEIMSRDKEFTSTTIRENDTVIQINSVTKRRLTELLTK